MFRSTSSSIARIPPYTTPGPAMRRTALARGWDHRRSRLGKIRRPQAGKAIRTSHWRSSVDPRVKPSRTSIFGTSRALPSPLRGIQGERCTALLARHALGRLDREADEEVLQDELDYASSGSGGLERSTFRVTATLRARLGARRTAPENRTRRGWAISKPKRRWTGYRKAHAIQSHTCQLLAATLVRQIRESRGSADTSRQHCLEWLTERESGGFEAFLSGTLTPITFASLLNLTDFVQDKEIKTRASRLCDRLLRQLAEHTLDGVTVGPQAEAHRQVLSPHLTASQGLLSFAVGHDVVESFTPWATFLRNGGIRPTRRPLRSQRSPRQSDLPRSGLARHDPQDTRRPVVQRQCQARTGGGAKPVQFIYGTPRCHVSATSS